MRRVCYGLFGTGLLMAFFGSGCVHSLPTKEDAKKPSRGVTQVDFSGVFEKTKYSNSVLAPRLDRKFMDRILLSPNVVFESSRSSMYEPKTFGPKAGSEPQAPTLKNALGKQISIDNSTSLVEFLVEHGSQPVAPVVTRLWTNHDWCDGKNCPNSTWVERVMLLHQQKMRDGESGKYGGGFESAQGSQKAVQMQMAAEATGTLNKDELPTSALAVRSLGLYLMDVPIVAKEYEGRIIVHQLGATDSQGESLCPDLVFEIPVASFQAEIVSVRDGRLLARLDERRAINPEISLTASINRYVIEAIRKSAYKRESNGNPIESSKYEYIAEWRRQDVTCDQIRSVADGLERRIKNGIGADLAVDRLMKQSLGKLYR